MLDVRFRRYGWFDEQGPLWFLRDRWTGGPRWRPCWVRFYAGPVGVTMQAHTKEGLYAYAGYFLREEVWSDLSYFHKEQLVMSWIKRIRNPNADPGNGAAATDPGWVQEFPALHDYLTLRTDSDGASRRTATLALFAESGSWKLYLNDRDTGASLCASGGSVADTLSALEAMLEADNAPWRFSDRPRQDGGRRGRKGS